MDDDDHSQMGEGQNSGRVRIKKGMKVEYLFGNEGKLRHLHF
jgi:hypothetical protein